MSKIRAKVVFDTKGLREQAAQERRIIRQEAFRAVQETATEARRALQNETLRGLTRGSRRASVVLRHKLHKGWRQKMFPPTPKTYRPAALILPDGKSDGRTWKALEAFAEGTYIRGGAGQYLTIPTAHAQRTFGKRDRRQRSPADWERRTGRKLELVPVPKRGFMLLVAARPAKKLHWDKQRRQWRKGRTEGKKDVIFVLVKVVGINQRLSVERTMRPFNDQLALKYLELADRARQRGEGFERA